ncbi:MAG: hypothetical protein ACXWNG_01805, partial [Candidatus Limnocylindrales bacterium]
IVIVVSEESGQISLVERARIVRNLDEPKLARAIIALLHPPTSGLPFGRGGGGRGLGGRAPRLADLGRAVRIGQGRGRAGGRDERPTPRSGDDQEPPAAAAATAAPAAAAVPAAAAAPTAAPKPSR